MVTFSPSARPVFFRPSRKACRSFGIASGHLGSRNPITGIVVFCARAEGGKGKATPPRRVMNSRRLIITSRMRPEALEATRVEIVTPTVGRQVLLTGLASLSLVCIAILTYQAVRYGWTVTMTNIRNMMIVLGFFLSVYVVFQWEFSLLSLAAMGCLPILVTGPAQYTHPESVDPLEAPSW